MDPLALESHLLGIEKIVESIECQAKTLSGLAISQLHKAAEKILNSECSANSTPITCKLRENWRDESLSLQPSNLGIFALKRKIPYSPRNKSTNHKAHLEKSTDAEIFEHSSSNDSEEEETDDSVSWTKNKVSLWKLGLERYNPEELFNPIKTPNGKGFVCNIQDIFVSKRAQKPKRAEAKWNN